MNKDVIYIEPEDDITDIISKLENSKEKIVALVPPKKAGVLRSIVNIKLINKSASNINKTVVFVTTDPSIVKIAAMVKLPVTKDLQTAPVIPSLENASEAEHIEITKEEESTDDSSKKETEESSTKSEETKDQSDDQKSPKKDEKNTKKSSKFIQWIKDHKKISIICACILVILIGVLIWAFAIAPAVNISVTIKTTTSNFSENVSLVSDLKSEKAEEGIFYYENKKKESKQEATFTATGSKNIGEKATGTLVIYASFPVSAVGGGNASVSTNDTFTFNNLNFHSTENVTLSWDGKFNSCDNAESIKEASDYCIKSAEVKAIADAPGTAYNISASTSGWTSSTSSVSAYSKSNFAGGTDNIVTIVTQSDVNKAKETLKTSDNTKEAFLSEIAKDESLLIVTQSYKETISDPVSTPAVGEQVNSGVTPKITVTTVQEVLTLDRTKVEEFISKKAKLGEDQKIYSIDDPFIENLSAKDSGFTGKLKTTFQSGSKVTENDILENVKGKKVGEVKAILSSITGVVKDATKIETSYFWVNTVPNDPNKITINLSVEED